MIYAEERSGLSEFYFDFSGSEFKLMQPVDESWPVVVDAIMMLSVGLPDKNGKDIYDGDLIKSPSDDFEYCLCEWNNKKACFQINGYGNSMYFNEGGGEEFSQDITRIEENVLLFGEDNDIEVVGNIYENPELIKRA